MDLTELSDIEPKFQELSPDELSEIQQFTLLWSLFESRKLDRRGSIEKIEEKVNALNIEAIQCEPVLDYFKQRYYPNETESDYFDGLNINNCIVKSRIGVTLRGETLDPYELLIVCLIIIYRYRNNLFHGEKWVYGIKDQKQNFENANELLKVCLRLFPDGI
ncbi:MAG: hypothetical protein ACJAS1_007500 [Oleiphilaceae bacterium]|jgi:hypothetical protein